jgi:endonuclease/exonuclease/phosphatase family metal-dependent hydrolase
MNFKVSLIFVFLLVFKAQAFQAATYNIRNFDYDERAQIATNKQFLLKTIKEIKADLISVQEIREKKEFKSFITSNFKDYDVILSDCGGFNEQHLGFIYDTTKLKLLTYKEDLRTVSVNQRSSHCMGSRPLFIAKFKNLNTGKVFEAISVHLKSGGSPSSIAKRFKQLNILEELVISKRKAGSKSFIIMGDFNSTEYSLKGEYHHRFKKIVKNMGLIDTSQKLKCSSYWWGGVDDGKNYPSLLDHIIVSEDMFTDHADVKSHCKRLSCNEEFEFNMGISFEEVSDHCPQVAALK